MLKRFFTTKAEALNSQDGHWRFIISDESVDRYGTVIKLKGWQMDNYGNNNVVFYNHWSGSSDPDNNVGMGEVYVDGKYLIGEVKLQIGSSNIKANKLQDKLTFGNIKCTSVGFMPIEASWGVKEYGEDPEVFYYRQQDLLEFSIVDIPANANATLLKSFDKEEQDFINTIEKKSKVSPLPTEPKEIIALTPGPDPYRTNLISLKRSTL